MSSFGHNVGSGVGEGTDVALSAPNPCTSGRPAGWVPSADAEWAMLHIGINLLYLRPGHVGGSETYVRHVVAGLSERDGVELTIFCTQQMAESLDPEVGRVVVLGKDRRHTLIRRLMWENVCLARRVRGIDVLYSPGNFAVPLIRSVPQVIMVHDLQHLHLRRSLTAFKRVQRSIMFRISLRTARRVITPSRFVLDDLLAHFRIDSESVTTIHHGFRPPPASGFPSGSTSERSRSDEPYFYYPATDFPHKNHRLLLEAFARFAREHHEGRLILTGGRGQSSRPLEDQIVEAGLADRVEHLGWVSYREVLELMSGARALVFPSRFEGFGLPLLEAMACGVPVVASTAPAIPEVAGKAALYADPDDVDAWSTALENILKDELLRRELVDRGRKNLRRFSWSKCVAETLAVLNEAARSSWSTND